MRIASGIALMLCALQPWAEAQAQCPSGAVECTSSSARCSYVVEIRKPENGRCVASLPYRALCVRRGAPKLEWTVDVNYEFLTAPNGITIIFGDDFNASFEVPLRPIKTLFTWKPSPTPENKPLQHKAQVQPAAGGNVCDAAEATITHTDQ